jgi:hypothetical protein
VKLLKILSIAILFPFSLTAEIPFWKNPPKEKIPPLTQELTDAIKAKPLARAQLKKNSNGASQIYINDVPRQPLMGSIKNALGSSLWKTEEAQVGVWKDVKYDILQVSVGSLFANLNKEKIESALWRVLRVYPEAKIILWVRLAAPPGWCLKNQEEAVRNEKGKAFIITNGAFDRLGNTPDLKKGEKLAWSFSSEKFRRLNSEMLNKFIGIVENSIPGRAVIGYRITGGADNQLYRWHPPNNFRIKNPDFWADYSKPAIKAWRNWLKRRYSMIENLEKAWKMELDSFETAPPPKASSLNGNETFHNPLTESMAIDWKRFLAESRSDFIVYFAKKIREYSSRKNIIVGVSSGESGVRSDVTDNWQLMQSPFLDFFVHQPHYGIRLPPSPGGIGAMQDSYQLNGKIFIADTDHLSWLVKPHKSAQGVIDYDSQSFGRASNINELRAMWRREFGRLWAAGAGMYFNPLRAPYTYLDDSIKKEFIELKKIAQGISPPSPQKPVADMAVIYDERSIDYLKGGLREMHFKWAKQQIFELDASGVPFRKYYADDLRAGKIPPAKIYIFLNQLDFDKELVAQIEKLKRDNSVLVFMQSSGFKQIQNDPEIVSSVLGMEAIKSDKASRYDESKIVLEEFYQPRKNEKIGLKNINWPNCWSVFGPFKKGDYCLKDIALKKIPEYVTINGKKTFPVKRNSKNGCVDLSQIFGGHKKKDEAFLYAEIKSPKEQSIEVGVGADWWMQCWINGAAVYDTLKSGNGKDPISIRNHVFKLKLNKGANVLVFRIIAGADSFLFLSGGPDELISDSFNPLEEGIRDDEQSGLAVMDKDAKVLAVYPKTGKAAFAIKDNKAWKSVFIGSYCLSRKMINKLAEYANAWRITPPGYGVAASNELLMVHPLKSGNVTLNMRKKVGLEKLPPNAFSLPPNEKHTVNMKAGETYLFRLKQ